MEVVDLDCAEPEARLLVGAALQNTEGIRQYHGGEDRIVAKTGLGLASWGEVLTVDLDRQSDAETRLHVDASREVWSNVTARPGRYEARFLAELSAIRWEGPREARQVLETARNAGRSKEESERGDLHSGGTVLFAFLGFLALASLALLWLVLSGPAV